MMNRKFNKAPCRFAISDPSAEPTYWTREKTLVSEVDGVLSQGQLIASVGDRVLIISQASAFYYDSETKKKSGLESGDRVPGIYEVVDTGSATTPWKLVRARDMNYNEEFVPGSLIPVYDGANKLKIYMLTSPAGNPEITNPDYRQNSAIVIEQVS